MKIKIATNDINKYLIVLLIILLCSTTFYKMNHALPTYICLCVLSVILFYKNKIISKNNLKVCCFFLIYWGTSCVFYFDFQRINLVGTSLIEVFTLLLLSSNVSKNEFQDIYIKLMFYEAVISLICFSICLLGFDSYLPGYVTTRRYAEDLKYSETYYTPYYTIGWLSTGGFFYRNAGVFSEPGVHAFMLCVALLFVLNRKLEKKYNIVLFVLISGLLSAASTTGFISLFFIGLLYVFKDLNAKNIRRKTFFFFIVIIISVIGVECGLMDKIIYQTSSYGTRLNDTISGAKLVLKSPWIGYGYFSSFIEYSLRLYDIRWMSNGFIGLLLAFGIPLGLLYCVVFYVRLYYFFYFRGVSFVILCLLFFFNMNSQALCFWFIVLTFFFSWKDDDTFIKIR